MFFASAYLLTFALTFLLHFFFFSLLCRKIKLPLLHAGLVSVFPAFVLLTYLVWRQEAFSGLVAAGLVFALVFSGFYAAFGELFFAFNEEEKAPLGVVESALLETRASMLLMVPFLSCVICLIVAFAPTSRPPVNTGRFETPTSYPVFFTEDTKRVWLSVTVSGLLLVGSFFLTQGDFSAPGFLPLLMILGVIFLLGLLQFVPERRTVFLTKDGLNIPRFMYGRLLIPYARIQKVSRRNFRGHETINLELNSGAAPDRAAFSARVVQNPDDLVDFLQGVPAVAPCLDIGEVVVRAKRPIAWKETFHPIAVGLLVSFNVLLLIYGIGGGAMGVAPYMLTALVQLVGLTMLVSTPSISVRRSIVWGTVFVLYFVAGHALDYI